MLYLLEIFVFNTSVVPVSYVFCILYLISDSYKEKRKNYDENKAEGDDAEDEGMDYAAVTEQQQETREIDHKDKSKHKI